ncbi:MAG TPA: BadF/BadG/BcrA/BcrD ATPase family protein, partial [Lacunisphaera sp.]|nr:BadF/BadG/BcrA/BcrD ATPase family protein [Lacunisphaera sp.]
TGTVVTRSLAPGCNPSQVGSGPARDILVRGLDALLIQSGIAEPKIAATHLYLAGSPQFWQETAAQLSGFGAVRAGPDSLPVLELATAGEAGLVLHAGTGSFVSARAPDGTVHYAGGLGWKLGDAGSGFDLGRRAIALALLELQARPSVGAPPLSPLAAALAIHTGFDDYAGNSRFFYNDAAANATITAFAPKVLELAERNCAPARQAVTDSVTDLARLADQVIHRLFPSPVGSVRCGVSGRLLNSPPAARALRAFAAQLRWAVDLHFITEAPIEGVRRLLAKT